MNFFTQNEKTNNRLHFAFVRSNVIREKVGNYEAKLYMELHAKDINAE